MERLHGKWFGECDANLEGCDCRTEITGLFQELKFPRSFSLVSPIISKSHLEKNRIIDKMLRRL